MHVELRQVEITQVIHSNMEIFTAPTHLDDRTDITRPVVGSALCNNPATLLPDEFC